MPKEKIETSQFVKMGEELSLEGEACLDIIRSTLVKNAGTRLRVRGFSMCPFIIDGDIITLSPLPPGMIGLGRAIAFIRPCDKKLVIHRLVVIRKGPPLRYITKGDGVNKPDRAISRVDMLAYVKKVERGGRTIFFGMGPERTVIAYLNRMNILWVLSIFWSLIIPRSIRIQIKDRLYF